MRYLLCSTMILAAAGFLSPATAVTPQPEEFQACATWADQVFTEKTQPSSRMGLKLLYQDVRDKVSRGRSWVGTPFQLGDKVYASGLAFNSTKHILVQVGRPVRSFTAEIGLENNSNTRQGQGGSVTFHVLAQGKELYASKVLRLKDGPLPIKVDLNGAQEFELRIKDGGDGRGWDQGLWANAAAVLEDGTSVLLQDLPWIDGAAQNPYGFSFKYGETNSARLLDGWSRKMEESPAERDRSHRKLTYLDPATGLEIQVQVERFSDFPAVEWVVNLANRGAANTPMLEGIQAFDGVLPVVTGSRPLLHWAVGGVASFDDFKPQTTVLKGGEPVRFRPGGGRSSNQVMPFFNVEGVNGGVIIAVGWTGEWAVEFRSTEDGQVSLKAGMARTHLQLFPGETIRTPRMLFLFYRGDRWQGQNLLRQFILAHHRPQRDGQPLVAPVTCGNWGGTPAAVHLDNIKKFIQYQLPIEYYWIDAEWYGQGGWAGNVGNWNYKRDLYPDGFKPLSDLLRSTKRELMLWFEPERVIRGTEWDKAHHEWMFDRGGDTLLLNLGNPEACKFVTDYISDRIEEYGLGCYRQDFNMDPLPYWEAADAPNRQGISEIRHIEGLYAFWDGLLKRHPNLILDNCASGGRRIDLETIGRATPFWRTDGPRDAIAHQCHSYGLLAWVPLSAISQDREGDTYEFRSSMCSALCINWAHSGDGPCTYLPADFPWAWAKTTLDQYMTLQHYYYGDYYPLTAYSQAASDWMVYQLDRPDLGKGLIVALRRPESPFHAGRFNMRGLDPKANYRLTNLDSRQQVARSGKQLTEDGLEITLETKPGSGLFIYERP